MPEPLVRTMERLQQNLSISVPTLSRIAAFDAHVELDTVRPGFADIHPVDGAFYAHADIGLFTNDSVVFCQHMLNETGISATPGVDFDPNRGHQTLRVVWRKSP